MKTVGILTISDKGYKGEREDKSSDMIEFKIQNSEFKIQNYKIVPDEKEMIKNALIEFCDNLKLDLILTTGGTGFAERDVTPDATKEIIEKETPGISEIIRVKTFDLNPHSVLSRSIAGIRGKSLIINLPGKPSAVCECLDIILPILSHAIEIIKGEFTEHN